MRSEFAQTAERGRSDFDRVAPIWQEIREYLRALKKPIDVEIRAYPPPIPACDAHFNHLLEQRNGLSRELVRLDVAQRDRLSGDDPMAPALSFLEASPFIGADAVQRIAKALEDRSPELARRVAALALPASPGPGVDSVEQQDSAANR